MARRRMPSNPDLEIRFGGYLLKQGFPPYGTNLRSPETRRMGITGLTECFEQVVFDEEVAHAFIFAVQYSFDYI
jgi:hypothetical protein